MPYCFRSMGSLLEELVEGHPVEPFLAASVLAVYLAVGLNEAKRIKEAASARDKEYGFPYCFYLFNRGIVEKSIASVKDVRKEIKNVYEEIKDLFNGFD